MQGISVVVLLLLIQQVAKAGPDGNEPEKNEEWYLANEAKGISLFYRWVTLDNGRETREMKATFVINAGIPEILTQFSSANNYRQWAAGIKDCEVEKLSDSLWIVHSLMNYPFPFRNKDVVSKYVLQNFKTHSILEIVSVPDHKPERKNVERIRTYRGNWTFFDKGKRETTVECRVVSGDKPMFPRFLQDPVVQKLTIDSFSELKQLAEAE